MSVDSVSTTKKMTFPVSQIFLIVKLYREGDTGNGTNCIQAIPVQLDKVPKWEGSSGVSAMGLWLFPLSCLRIAERV